jgi:hypothetical protein
LHVQPANAAGFGKHLGLRLKCGIPARLAAHGGIHGEDQPPVAGLGDHGRGLHLRQELVNAVARGGGIGLPARHNGC